MAQNRELYLARGYMTRDSGEPEPGRIEPPPGLGLARGPEVVLPAGIIEITAAITLRGAHLALSGAPAGSGRATRLRRGRLPNGDLYKGPLIDLENAQHVTLRDLIVDGCRFDGARDRRHPLDADRGSPRFVCAYNLGEPACYEPAARVSDYSPDIMVSASSHVMVRNLALIDPVRIGLAIGRGCKDVAISACTVSAAGDYGVWMGSGLGGDVALPLSTEQAHQVPTRVEFSDCRIEKCGAAGCYVEARQAIFRATTLSDNHRDAPYDDESGQLVIDYKAQDTRLIDCRIAGGAGVVRRRLNGQADALLGTFGIEASGDGLLLADIIIEGNSREGIQLVGARNVRITGERTRIAGNHLLTRREADAGHDRPQCNISVTTTGEMRRLNVVAHHLELEGVRCENGVVVWPHPSAEDLAFDGLAVRDCDLSGPVSSGIMACDRSDGVSVRGRGWTV